MKKTLLLLISAFVVSLSLSAQNVQLHYDLGRSIYKKDLSFRPVLTSTIENFKIDKWGNTFFFVDFDYGSSMQMAGKQSSIVTAYWEIAREFTIGVPGLNAHIEYNGGLNSSFTFNNAYLAGPSYTMASKDFSKVFTFMLLYKYIQDNPKPNSVQFTTVWNMFFFDKKLQFTGFLDIWKEHRPWQGTEFIFLTEPQIWYNLNTIPSLKDVNLSVGSELELGANMYKKGFFAIPTLALKWTF